MYESVMAADAAAVSDAEWAVPGWGIVVGVVLAALVVVWIWDATAELAEKLRKAVDGGTAQGLAPAAKWKIGDSWASDLTALTAAVAAAATAFSDKLSGAVDPGAAVTYGIGGAMLLTVAAVAGPAYATLQRYLTNGTPLASDRQLRRIDVDVTAGYQTQTGGLIGTYPGLLIAAFLTLASVFGSLAMTGMLIQVGIPDAPAAAESFAWVAIVVAGLLIAVYAIRTITWLLLDALKGAETRSTLAGIVGFDCCGNDRERRPERRVSLL